MPVLNWLKTRMAWLRARPRLFGGIVLGAFALAGLLGGLGLGTWNNICRDCPSIAQIYVWEPKQSTKILAHDGQLVAELGEERRTPVSIATLPPHVPQAFIAVEDRRFYEHSGYSLRGIARAFIMRVPGLGAVLNRRAGGGSTITQQLARHMFQEQLGFEQRMTRKIKELRTAIELERVYSKDQILEAYVNQVNYGRGHYGLESASLWFFGKSATSLNPAEAAMLAAVINLPERYSPFRNPELALQRRNLVLTLMERQGYLSSADAERWKQEPLPEQPSSTGAGSLAPYFVEWVRQGLDDRYGPELYRKGFRVITTLDVEMQNRAQAAMERGWARIEGMEGFNHPKYDPDAPASGFREGETPYLQGVFIALDPATGEVRALVGGRDFNDSKFNRATQARRQPGSVFKPFVYTAAIASGIPASHVIFDAPLMLEQVDGTTWAPKNYEGDFRGPMTLRQALKLSVNIVAVKLAMEVGMETVAQTARRMGIETPIPRYPSTAIGAAEVIPLEVSSAYTVFANQGVRARPRAILRVEDADGRVLWEPRSETERVLDPTTAFIITDLLRDVVDHGTGYPARNPAIGNFPYEIPAGGKTGTTNDATDVWFVGFTPNLLATVWFGFDRPTTILPRAAGGVYAAPVWAEFMRSAYVGDSALVAVPAPWQAPANITAREIDRESGKLATEWCPRETVVSEFFAPGTEPTEACDLHGPGTLGAPLRAVHPDSAGGRDFRF